MTEAAPSAYGVKLVSCEWFLAWLHDVMTPDQHKLFNNNILTERRMKVFVGKCDVVKPRSVISIEEAVLMAAFLDRDFFDMNLTKVLHDSESVKIPFCL